MGSRSATEAFLRRRCSSAGFAYIMLIFPPSGKDYVKTPYQAGRHRNVSDALTTFLPVRRKAASFQKTLGPIGRFCSSVAVRRVHGGLTVSGMAMQPRAASPASPESPDCFLRTSLAGQLPGCLPNKHKNDLKPAIVPYTFFVYTHPTPPWCMLKHYYRLID